MPSGRRRSIAASRGFTLIELLVVMSIIGLLASLVAPRYIHTLDRTKEKALATTLSTLREAIDQFAADKGRYPATLEELAQPATGRYLRAVPEDPITGRRDTWVLLPATADALVAGAVADVRSGATGQSSDGRRYADW